MSVVCGNELTVNLSPGARAVALHPLLAHLADTRSVHSYLSKSYT